MKLDKDKLVIEELSRMKSLFGYERGRIISEQGNMTGTAGVGMTGPFMPSPSAPTYNKADTANDPKWYNFLELWAKGRTGKLKVRDDQVWYYSEDGDIWNFKKNGEFIYSQVTPKEKIFKGKWHVNLTTFVIRTDDGDEYTSKTNKWKFEKTPTNSNNSGHSSTPPQIPTELKDINGVKAFQDWLDENKAGWASGYANGVLNKLGKGYGRMGPRTTKAWGLFKDEYLNPQKLTQDIPDITTQEIQQINAGTQPQSDLGAQTPVTNTTTTTTSTETISQYPPDEPGQPGEYRDGWYYDEKSQQWYKPQ
jgi:hypothetical protein